MASSTRYPPDKESAMVTASQTFITVATANLVACGLVAGQLTSLTTKRTAFVADFDTCQLPSTKTKVATQAKLVTKRALLDEWRLLTAVAQASPLMTNELRTELAIPLRDLVVSPIYPPDYTPVMEIVKIANRTVSIAIRKPGSTKRAWPSGVTSANIFSHVGETAPEDVRLYVFEGSSSKTDLDLEFSAAIPAGSKMFLTCQFKTARQLTSPACVPIPIYLGGGVSSGTGT